MPEHPDLFSARSNAEENGQKKPATEVNPVDMAAHRLAIAFSEESDIPVRFRRKPPSSGKSKAINSDSDIETRFRENVSQWKELIDTMMAKLDNDMAWRFINLSPRVAGKLKSVTDCQDFCDFMDYLSLRRGQEHCGVSELGGLALLTVAFQREIEKKLEPAHAHHTHGSATATRYR